jgi:anti-sigma factor RsiW
LTDEQLELIHREIDGEMTAEESARVRELLATDDEAQRCHDELRILADHLDHVERVAPPPDLRANILRSIRRAARTERRIPFGGLRNLVDRLRPGHGYAFATGLAAGIALLAFVSADRMRGLDDSLASGSLVRPAPSATAEIVDRIQLESAGTRSVVVARREAGTVWLELEVDSGEAVEIELAPGDGSWKPLGFEQSRPGAALTMRPDRVSIRHHGETRYRIAFDAAGLPSSVRVTLRSSQGATIERTLKTTGPEAPASSVTRSATHPGS